MLRIIRISLLICAELFLIVGLSFGQTRLDQTMRLGHLGTEHGLSQGMVFCMFQDSHGFMWFGTKEGLNRYDGNRFLVYQKEPGDSTSLPDNYVFGITEDARGRLWIATASEGLVMFEPDHERFTRVPLFDGNGHARTRRIDDVEVDGEGRLWVSARDVELISLDVSHERVEEIVASAEQHPPMRREDNQEVNRLRRDVFGRLTFLTEVGLYILDERQKEWRLAVEWERFFGQTENASRFFSAAVMRDSTIWLSVGIRGVTHQLHVSADGKTALSKIVLRIGDDDLRVRDMMEGPDGMLYLVSFHYVIRFDPVRNTFVAVREDKSNEGGYVSNGNHLFQSRGGIIWISTSGYGINTFDPATLAFQARSGPINTALFEREFKAFDRYIRKETGGTLGLVNAAYPLRTEDGSVWCGTLDHGLLHYNAQTGRVRQYALVEGDHYSFLMMRMYRPFVDSRGRIWTGNRHGISRLDSATGEWEYYWFTPDGPDLTEADDFITSYHETDDGSIWLGTKMHGLVQFNPEDGSFFFHRYDSGDSTSISHDHILTLEADPKLPQRYLWVGTDGGALNRFDRETQSFRRYGKREGLPNAVIYGILSDEAGFLWLSTNEGLCRMNAETGEFRCYDVRDGLQGNEFNRIEYYRINDTLCFGGVDGFNMFHPAAIQDNPVIPPVVLTRLRLFNKPMLPGAPDSPLIKALPYTSEIRLSHDQNMLTIEFAALDFHAPDRNCFRYKLEGFTRGWIDAGTEGSATFTNLDPGEYLLHVIGSNNHGVWNSEGTTLRIVIEPPWWMTYWAYGIYAILLLGTVFAFDRIQRKRLIARERAQSHLRETQRRAESAEFEARAVRAENERKQKEMQVASVIQQRVLPQQLPRLPGYDMAAINLPADEVGGDYYDCITMKDGRVVMVMADVTGKGVAASLLVNSLHAALRVHLDHEMDTITVVRRLNSFLYQSTPPNAFITFMIAVLLPETGEVDIVNAGHNPALIHENSSVVETQRSKHLPLGCMAYGRSYHSERFVLNPGEGMLLFTDGITEAMNRKREPFGQEALERLLKEHKGKDASMLLGVIVAELQHYAQGAEQSDDITALYLRRS